MKAALRLVPEGILSPAGGASFYGAVKSLPVLAGRMSCSPTGPPLTHSKPRRHNPLASSGATRTTPPAYIMSWR